METGASLCGDEHEDDASACKVVGIGHVLAHDPSIEAVLDLAPGWTQNAPQGRSAMAKAANSRRRVKFRVGKPKNYRGNELRPARSTLVTPAGRCLKRGNQRALGVADATGSAQGPYGPALTPGPRQVMAQRALPPRGARGLVEMAAPRLPGAASRPISTGTARKPSGIRLAADGAQWPPVRLSGAGGDSAPQPRQFPRHRGHVRALSASSAPEASA